MALKLFDRLFPDEQLHEKFILLRDSYLFEKEVINEWVEEFKDRDNKIIKEFQTTFHSSFWEFYLHKVFYELGFKIKDGYARPDFLIEKPTPFIVEATVAQIKKDGRPEHERNLDDMFESEKLVHLRDNFTEIITEATIRNSNAVWNKLSLYKKSYSQLEWVKPTMPYVIALSSYNQIDYGYEFIFSMLQLLYGVELNISTFIESPVERVLKPGTESSYIDLNLFSKNEFEDVSAILFSCTTTLGKLTSLSNSAKMSRNVDLVYYDITTPQFILSQAEEQLTEGLFLFHNPNAKNPLSKEFFDKTSILQFDGNSFDGKNLALYARYVRPFFTAPFSTQVIQESVHKANFLAKMMACCVDDEDWL